jgi:signal transduction histidine kinase
VGSEHLTLQVRANTDTTAQLLTNNHALKPWGPSRSLHTQLWLLLAPALLLAGAVALMLHTAFASAAVLVAWGVVAAGGLAFIAQRCTARAWAGLAHSLHQKAGPARHGTADTQLADLPLPALTDVQPVVLAINRVLAQQRSAVQQHQRFLADASHQLRTPLAVLRTQLQASVALQPGPQQAAMLRTLDRATAVADELLARLKIEQQQRQALPWQPIDLHTVACEAALEFAPLIADKRLQFSLDDAAAEPSRHSEAGAPITVAAEAWMLGELVRNLLANAVRHTPHGQPLGVVVRRVAGAPELIVWDSGDGITNATRERLFEPFAAATGGSGVGLGLSICRQLAQALGAEVQLYNRSDGHRVVGVDAVVRWAIPAPTPTGSDSPAPAQTPTTATPHGGVLQHTVGVTQPAL